MLNQTKRIIKDALKRMYFRFSRKCHVTRTSLDPSHYWDAKDRILHGAFSELVDFVEIDLAWMAVVFSDEAAKLYNCPFWCRSSWFRIRPWRCRRAGVDYLEHLAATSADPDVWIQVALLFRWWVAVRPARPTTEQLYQQMDEYREKSLTFLPEQFRNKVFDADSIEQMYDAEDDRALLQLIQVRQALCT